MQKSYHAAVYLRLSREDGDVIDGGKTVSNSIANQKELVMDYLKSHHEISVVSTYTDDGYSGVNFERPQFQKMISDIRAGKIECVIVKDLSRFGRNYIESGRYIEKIFPMLGIRFIAITDGYDSINEDMGSEMIIPFKNLINDAYCRDISIKIRSHMDIKRRNGEYIGAFAAYGYLKDKDNKNHLVIDEYAADVVRDIFTMKICGMSQQAIADKLNADGILSPMQYKKSIGLPMETGFAKSTKPKWSYNAVLRVLKNEVYIGTVVQGKRTTPNYKIKKRINKAEGEWIRVGNMHDAIISKSDFDLVQGLLMKDTRVSPEKSKVFPLAGMVYCAGCGEPMVRKSVPGKNKVYVYYVCSGNKRDKHSCSSHNISEKKLVDCVTELVKAYIDRVVGIYKAIELVKKAPENKPKVKKQGERIDALKAEIEACNTRKRNLYEDYKDGILTKEEFIMIRDQYEGELNELQTQVSKLQEERDKNLNYQGGRQEWIDEIIKFKGMTKLKRNVAASLIDRIEVEDSGKIRVAWRFEKAIAELEGWLDDVKEAI